MTFRVFLPHANFLEHVLPPLDTLFAGDVRSATGVVVRSMFGIVVRRAAWNMYGQLRSSWQLSNRLDLSPAVLTVLELLSFTL